MTIYRYGIIGCGMMGREHIHNIALLDSAQVSVIYEPDAHMAAQAQALCPDARLVTSLDAIITASDVDCFLIASPNFRHAEQIIEIASKNPLPLLVEKPLFTTLQDGAALQRVAKAYPAPIWVAMEYRYMPPIAAFLERCADVTGGVQMLSIREHRFPFLTKVQDWNRFNRFSGGTFVEKCCHFFDLMRVVMAAEPVRIMASAGQAVNHLDERYDGQVPDILDHGYVIVDFETGARAMLELCMFADGAQYQEELSAVGARGKIEAFVPGPGRFWPPELGPAPVPKLVESPRAPKSPREFEVPVPAHLLAAGDHNGATYFQHQGFVRVMSGEQAAPDVGVEDGFLAVAMGMAAQVSTQSGQSVDFEKFLASLRKD